MTQRPASGTRELRTWTPLLPAGLRVSMRYSSVRTKSRVVPPCHTRNVFALSGLSALVSPTTRSEEHTSELQSPCNLVCRLLLEKKKKTRSLEILRRQDTCAMSHRVSTVTTSTSA